jgi:hypothetical protein
MCIYKFFIITRDIIDEDGIMLKSEDFDKISSDVYLRILAGDIPVSRSYYYRLSRRLKELGLIKDKAINFKFILSFRVSQGELRIEKKIILVDKKEGVLIFVNLSSPHCPSCPLLDECIKSVTKTLGRVKGYPCLSWNELITYIMSKFLLRAKSFKGELIHRTARRTQ